MKREAALPSFARTSLEHLARRTTEHAKAESVATEESIATDAAERSSFFQRLTDQLIDEVFCVMCESRGLRSEPLVTRVGAPALTLTAEERNLFADPEALGHLYEISLGLELDDALEVTRTDARRRSGSHYTPRILAEEVVEQTLAPLLAGASIEDVAALRICDPAMGTGAFVFAATRRIANALVDRGMESRRAHRIALLESVRGVDRDAGAVRVAKLIAWMVIGDPDLPGQSLDKCFVVGDALVGHPAANLRDARRDPSQFFESRGATPPRPLDWTCSFSDVFARENPGFDAFVGNPPFIGGKRIATMLGPAYAAWLRGMHEGANGNTDLSAHFLRRAFDLTRRGGRIGFITTNTIAQGDTRTGGLGHICTHGGEIVSARTRVEWPGDAAVVVSIVCIEKTSDAFDRNAPRKLDERDVASITAFLEEGHEKGDPARLDSQRHIAFIGCFLRGMGFTFDDDQPNATPLAVMRSVVTRDPSAARAIRPYLGGEEINVSPTLAHHRYAIDLYPLEESDARRAYPSLVELLEKKVRPDRDALGHGSADRAHRARWWRFANDRPELRSLIANLGHVFAIPRVTAHLSLVRLPTHVLCSEQVVVIALDDWGAFALLQSRVHEIWARRHASTLGDGMRYTPTDCFETFPFPSSRDSLADTGRAYYELRSETMMRANEGLTLTWRRFHDPRETNPAILELRKLHDAMDRAVLKAYRFDDLNAVSSFSPDLRRHPRAGKPPAMRLGWGAELSRDVFERLMRLNELQASSRRQGESG